MKYASVCSGVEAASLAWIPLGWEAAWFSEIEPFLCAVLKERFPNVPNLGDMTKIKVENLQNGDQKYYGEDGANVIIPGGVDLLVGGTPCFPAGTLVLTPYGYKPIDTLQVGDEVVSHLGNVCKVSATGSKIAPIGQLKIIGRPEIPCTANHPFLTIDVKRDCRRKSETYSQIVPAGEWDFTAAENSVGKYAGRLEVKQTDYCVPQTTLSEEDLLEFAGWYVGDGYIRTFKGKNKKAVILALVSERKIKRFNDSFSGKINFCTGADGKITVYNTKIAEFLIENFGHLSSGKKIPYWLYSREQLKKAFLFGLEMTDGCRKENCCNITTISEPLAYGIADLYGNASVRLQEVEPQTKIQGRTVNQHDYYIVSKISTKAVKTKFINGRYASRVKEYKDGNGTVGTVFNITVSGDHTYIVNGIAVHNCQGFSVAGKQGGLNDDRSVLCLTYIKLLETMRPRWFVWENVPGVFSTNEGDDFKEFIRQIDEIGYHVAWRVLDAQYVRVDGFPRAVPQRRRRVFVIGHLGGWQYPAEVLFEQNCLFRDTPPCRVKGKGFTSDVKRCVGAASTVRMRAGCEGGGKGALVSHERSLTLAAAGNDQAVFCNNGKGVDCYNQAVTGDVSMPVTSAASDFHHIPSVIETNRPWDASGVNPTLNQCNAGSGIIGASNQELFSRNFNGLVMSIGNGQVDSLVNEPELAQTLNCMHDQQAVLCYENHGQDSRVKKLEGVCTQLNAKAGTGGGNLPLVQECYVKTAKPTFKGGCETYADTGVAPTINCFDQGDKRANELVCETVAIAENVIGRQVQNGGNGIGAQEELAYTQNTSGVMGVANHATVRRLLPIETERLMGFPEIEVLKIGKMTKDEFIAWELAQGNISVDIHSGKVFSHRTGGGNHCPPRELQGTILNGYRVVSLREKEVKKQCRVHRIVWIAANGMIPENMTIDHVNNNKQDNRIENLQLLTAIDNSKKAHSEDLIPHRSKVSQEAVWEILTLNHEHNIPIKKLTEHYGISKSRFYQLVKKHGWTQIPWKGKSAEDCPDSPRYKACGNSMCVNVMRWIGMRIENVERKTRK